MEDHSGTKANFMSLPRELRDQIYRHLVVSIYRVNTSPSMRYNRPLEADGAFNPKEAYYRATSAPLFSFERPSDRIAILQVSRVVGEEAREELYRSSTFVFNIGSSIGHSMIDFSHLGALHMMQHIHIYANLKATADSGPVVDFDAFDSSIKLLRHFAGNTIKRDTCIIHYLYQRPKDPLIPIMLSTLRSLTGFKNVELRVDHSRSGQCAWSSGSGPSQLVDGQSVNSTYFDGSMVQNLSPGSIWYSPRSVLYWNFQPRLLVESIGRRRLDQLG